MNLSIIFLAVSLELSLICLSMQKVRLYRGLLLSGIFLMLAALVLNNLCRQPLLGIADHISQKFSEKAVRCDKALKQLASQSPAIRQESFFRLFDRHQVGVYLFQKDSLVFWNNAQIPLETGPAAFAGSAGFTRLSHGYYFYITSAWQNYTALALCLVKPQYGLQNNYLKNDAAAWTGIPTELDISTDTTAANVVSLNGRKLFSLKGHETSYAPEWAPDTCLVIFALGWLVLLTALLLRVRNGMTHLGFVALMGGVLLLRFAMPYFKWPAFFYESFLYDVHVFGDATSGLNPYLGDVLFNAATLMFITGALHFQFAFGQQKTRNAIQLIAFFVVCFLGLNQFNHTVVTLVANSTLDFDFLSIFTVKLPAFAGVLALAIYSTALYVAIHNVILLFYGGIRGLFQTLLFIAGVCLLQFALSGSKSLFENGWLLFFAFTQYLLALWKLSKVSLGMGLQILAMSLITSVFLNFYIDQRQHENLELLSLELSQRQDAILENEFSGIPARMVADEKLSVLMLFLPNGKKEIEQLLRQKYFGEYFNRYNVDLSLFDEDCNPLLMPKEAVLLNQGFFEDQIRYNADSTFVPGLFFVRNYKNNSPYIGKIPLKGKNLYVLMEPKQFEELGSFPDLLLDQSQQKQDELKNFSYAVYRSGRNTSRYGNFNYPFFELDSMALAKANPGYLHHYFRNDESLQVISQKTKTWTDKFTYNSYVFLFFSVISYCAYFLYTMVFTSRLQNPSLTRRIQSIIIVLLLFLMSAVGVTSGKLVSGQFEADNRQQLQEKTEIIISELLGQFKSQEFFEESQKDIVNLKLNEYGHLFNTVISLFDRSGRLFNTSQPRLYELGLAASLANPRAFHNLGQNRSSAESVTETAGNLDYVSLYTPIYDEKQLLIGFVNLPYFARQSNLVNELSGIISALINVYVILFVISILAGLILSGYITQPLRLIKQQIANISLGSQNEKINWNSSDEIGKLVAEYNQMLVKLEHSAGLLAQSERESAWREMAKQVAHEIKNPLTPMKLNLQYLQHLIKHNPDDFKEKFEKASAGIIEQIDSLASIANEFSNFAKLPAAQLEEVNLAEIIAGSVQLFEHHKNVSIKNTISKNQLMVMGDKDQCLRIFNNILKNAVQALDGVENPLIEISAEQRDSAVVIRISDNGCGIDEALKPKIFSPNFTTKSTGSGLGLAMVKNIMDGFGGKIWFNSEKDKGTNFYLEFRKVGGGNPTPEPGMA
jgi:two-component system nitrogen regulation sensor histidine kinase NtrY